MKKLISLTVLCALCLCLLSGCELSDILKGLEDAAGEQQEGREEFEELNPGQMLEDPEKDNNMQTVKPGIQDNVQADVTEGPSENDAPVSEELTAEYFIPYIAMYNSCENGCFGAQYDDSVSYRRVFESENDLQNRVEPIAVVDNTDSRYEQCNDPTYSTGYRVTNFTTMDAVVENLLQYFTEDFVFAQDLNFVEFEGNIYLFFGSMGYGAYQIGTEDVRIGERTQQSCVVYAPTLYFEENVGDAQLYFNKQADGSWRLDTVSLA